MIFLLCLLTVVFVLLMLKLDCDITTWFYEKTGTNLHLFYSNKVVWVTGSSTGIGAALAVQAAKYGAKLVLTARQEPLLNEVRTKCIAAGAAEENILVLPLDLCEFSKHKEAFDTVLNKFGRLDVMIHNAGRSQRARWEHIDLEVDRSMFDLNVFSVINLTRVILPHMLTAKQGMIGIMSSPAGKSGVPFSGTYTGSKHALHGYFESLRNEKVGSGIDITMLCPGPTFSNLLQVAATEKFGERFGESMKPGDKRMTAERCAELSLIAVANKIKHLKTELE
ncbi:dehydrogenase/reductase SDR family member 7-like isoform X2 [Eurytemora carolleeae]|uniref:dehydrogenase/reductase SDR family member 7-like isoform X2 n=1 Tax=Eurytemora carolleeae TaxID=1294199 RepID=UPI000C7762C2|nr:dehydrogenase/reductase SDR family member 7-like isoform X2 [Eurytemora carolleeae]|eukprot:XP_023334248.1 dehydrogenase/reductase SDR family member 7-like isoform X2 [Eurytemora affinis]